MSTIARRTAWTAALPLLAILSLTGCSSKEATIQSPTLPDEVRRIAIDGGPGKVAIKVVPNAQAMAEATANYRYDEPTPTDAYSVKDGVLTLRTGCGQSCSIDHTVTVPNAVSVIGETGSGGVTMTGVGDVTLKAGSGDLAVKKPQGSAKLTTGSGSATVEGAPEKVDVRTGSGSVTLRFSAPPEASVRAQSGDVDVHLSENPHRLTVNTNSGDQKIDVTEGAVGGGNLTVTTQSGNVAVTRN